MGIIEVLVAAGLLAIITVGIATFMVNAQVEEKRIQVKGVVADLKARHAALLTDNRSWVATMSNAANAMACLETGCADLTPKELKIFHEGPGGVPVQFPAPAPPGKYPGFTESGAECQDFKPPTGTSPWKTGTGNDACPIGISAVWQPLTTKGNTSVQIVVRTVYNGSASNKFQNSVETSYKNSVGAYPLFDTTLDVGKNDFKLVRNATSVGKQFVLNQHSTTNLGVDTAGGGECPGGMASAGNVRVFTSKDDPSNLVTLNLVNGTWTFQEAGLYKCSITASAFNTNAFTAILFKGATNMGSASGFAGVGTQVSVNFETILTVLTADLNTTVYSLAQKCQTIPWVDPFDRVVVKTYAMGMPVPNYAPGSTRFAAVSCVKMDE